MVPRRCATRLGLLTAVVLSLGAVRASFNLQSYKSADGQQDMFTKTAQAVCEGSEGLPVGVQVAALPYKYAPAVLPRVHQRAVTVVALLTHDFCGVRVVVVCLHCQGRGSPSCHEDAARLSGTHAVSPHRPIGRSYPCILICSTTAHNHTCARPLHITPPAHSASASTGRCTRCVSGTPAGRRGCHWPQPCRAPARRRCPRGGSSTSACASQ